MALKHTMDGAASILAAIATAVITGLPCWFTYKSIQYGIVPNWAWVSIGALGFVGLVMVFAFLRKGFSGIAPTRERRRR